MGGRNYCEWVASEYSLIYYLYGGCGEESGWLNDNDDVAVATAKGANVAGKL